MILFSLRQIFFGREQLRNQLIRKFSNYDGNIYAITRKLTYYKTNFLCSISNKKSLFLCRVHGSYNREITHQNRWNKQRGQAANTFSSLIPVKWPRKSTTLQKSNKASTNFANVNFKFHASNSGEIRSFFTVNSCFSLWKNFIRKYQWKTQ